MARALASFQPVTSVVEVQGLVDEVGLQGSDVQKRGTHEGRSHMQGTKAGRRIAAFAAALLQALLCTCRAASVPPQGTTTRR